MKARDLEQPQGVFDWHMQVLAYHAGGVVRRIEISPTWVFRNEDGDEVDHRLFPLLQAIAASGKLTVAARQAELSYRHAWNMLARWATFFGGPLVVLTQGRGARLSPLGEKLAWVEARARARLLPQLENVASELNLEIGRVMADPSPTLRLHASYGYGVAKLPELLRSHGGIRLDLHYLSAADALASLARGACDVAGFHVPEGALGARAAQAYQPWLTPDQQQLIFLVRRQQGLFVAPGNPKAIVSLRDLVRRDVRFVNRQRGSGTRLLLESLLEAQAIDPRSIAGYDVEENTHGAVAAHVAGGTADAGLGVAPAAREFKLGFVPLAAESYFLICARQTLRYPWAAELVTLLRSAAFRALMDDVPGYDATRAGELVDVDVGLGLPRAAATAAKASKPTRARRRVTRE